MSSVGDEDDVPDSLPKGKNADNVTQQSRRKTSDYEYLTDPMKLREKI